MRRSLYFYCDYCKLSENWSIIRYLARRTLTGTAVDSADSDVGRGTGLGRVEKIGFDEAEVEAWAEH